jgi:tetratricopeptide (TPR) repeat protein
MLGDFYFTFGQVDKAMAEYESLYQEHPNDLRVKKNYVQLLIIKDRIDEATQLNDEILKKNGKDVDGLTFRGQILNSRGKSSDAIPVLESAVKAEADNPTIHYHLGMAYSNVGNLARAESEWREAVRLRPQFVAAQQALGSIAVRKGDWDLLSRTAEEVLRVQPWAAQGYLMRAASSVGRNNLAAAEIDLKKAIEIAPQAAETYWRLGIIRINQKRYPEAEKLFEQALERSPSSPEAMQGLIATYMVQKQAPKALTRLNAQVARVPDSSAFQFLLGGLLINEKQWEQAEAALEKAIALDRNNMDAFVLLGQLQATRGSLEKAIASYQRALQENPRDVRFYMLLGSIEEGRNNWQSARELYEKALQVQPDYPLAANNLAYILLEHGGNVDVALSLAQVARRGLPDAPQAADTLAWAYYHKGAYALAIGLLQEAVKKLPQNATYHYHLGMAYQKSGDRVQAKSHLQRALQINPDYPAAAQIRRALAELGG